MENIFKSGNLRLDLEKMRVTNEYAGGYFDLKLSDDGILFYKISYENVWSPAPDYILKEFTKQCNLATERILLEE